MKNRSKTVIVFDILTLLLSVLLLLGTKFVFHACGPMEDGHFMVCHWAEQAAAGIGAALTVVSLIKLAISSSKVKAGIAAAIVPFSVLAALIPGVLIDLCMMAEMQCRAVMRPAVIIVSLILSAAAAVNAAILFRTEK